MKKSSVLILVLSVCAFGLHSMDDKKRKVPPINKCQEFLRSRTQTPKISPRDRTKDAAAYEQYDKGRNNTRTRGGSALHPCSRVVRTQNGCAITLVTTPVKTNTDK